MAWKLADLFVEFTGRGADVVKKDMDSVKAGIASVTSIAQTGFAVATASLGGWVAMGLQGTVQGDQLALSTQRLAREITAVFLPAIRAATDFIRDITDWFRDLTGEQQDNIMKWTLWGGAALGVVVIGSKLVPVISLLVTGIRGLAGAFALLNIASGGFLTVLAGVAAAVTAVVGLLSYFFGSDDKKAAPSKAGGHRSVELSGGGMESITSTYNRIQMAANRSGTTRNYAEETAKNTELIGAAAVTHNGFLGSIDRKTKDAVTK